MEEGKHENKTASKSINEKEITDIHVNNIDAKAY